MYSCCFFFLSLKEKIHFYEPEICHIFAISPSKIHSRLWFDSFVSSNLLQDMMRMFSISFSFFADFWKCSASQGLVEVLDSQTLIVVCKVMETRCTSPRPIAAPLTTAWSSSATCVMSGCWMGAGWRSWTHQSAYTHTNIIRALWRCCGMAMIRDKNRDPAFTSVNNLPYLPCEICSIYLFYRCLTGSSTPSRRTAYSKQYSAARALIIRKMGSKTRSLNTLQGNSNPPASLKYACIKVNIRWFSSVQTAYIYRVG